MLRLRKEDGEVIELPDYIRFIEICDKDGGIAQLVYQDAKGLIHSVKKEDDEAEAYARMFDVTFVPIIKL